MEVCCWEGGVEVELVGAAVVVAECGLLGGVVLEGSVLGGGGVVAGEVGVTLLGEALGAGVEEGAPVGVVLGGGE